MEDFQKDKKITYPRLSDGTIVTPADLPPPTLPPGTTTDEFRWTLDDKAIVVAAMGKLISWEDAEKRWRLSREEFETWKEALETSGKKALKATVLRGTVRDINNNPKYVERAAENSVQKDRFTLYPESRRIVYEGFEEYLSKREFNLFTLFLANKDTFLLLEEMQKKIPGFAPALISVLQSKLSQISSGRKWLRSERDKGWIYSGVPIQEK